MAAPTLAGCLLAAEVLENGLDKVMAQGEGAEGMCVCACVACVCVGG